MTEEAIARCKKAKLDELDTYNACAIVAFQYAEAFLTQSERIYAEMHRESKEYKAIKKKLGKAHAEMYAKNCAHKVLNNDDLMNVSALRDCVARYKHLVQKVHTVGTLANNLKALDDAGITYAEMFEAMIGAVSFGCQAMMLLSDARRAQDDLVILSTLRSWATQGQNVTGAMLDKFALNTQPQQ